jgi:hypothetical protein
MFFSRLAMILASAMLLVGLISVLLAVAATLGVLDEAIRARFIVQSTDQTISVGLLLALAAAALGTLAEMSLSVRKWIP